MYTIIYIVLIILILIELVFLFRNKELYGFLPIPKDVATTNFGWVWDPKVYNPPKWQYTIN